MTIDRLAERLLGKTKELNPPKWLSLTEGSDLAHLVLYRRDKIIELETMINNLTHEINLLKEKLAISYDTNWKQQCEIESLCSTCMVVEPCDSLRKSLDEAMAHIAHLERAIDAACKLHGEVGCPNGHPPKFKCPNGEPPIAIDICRVCWRAYFEKLVETLQALSCPHCGGTGVEPLDPREDLSDPGVTMSECKGGR